MLAKAGELQGRRHDPGSAGRGRCKHCGCCAVCRRHGHCLCAHVVSRSRLLCCVNVVGAVIVPRMVPRSQLYAAWCHGCSHFVAYDVAVMVAGPGGRGGPCVC